MTFIVQIIFYCFTIKNFLTKNNYFHLIATFLLFFNCPFSFCIEINHKKFTHATIHDGLSSHTINSMINDKRGYLWLGTDNGLNRYDGYEFKVYTLAKTASNTISDNKINDLIEDHNGDIWIATDNGLNKFDIRTETFKSFYSHKIIHGHIVHKLLIDDDNLWIASDNGLLSLNLNNHAIIKIFDNYAVYDIELENEYLWLGSNGRIFSYRKNSGLISEFLFPVYTTVDVISKYKNTLWFGSREGDYTIF